MSVISGKHVARRTMLRGLGAPLALPFLDAMVPARSRWDTVVSAGVTPAGLGARDTLRLEAGLPLHGHELGPGVTPLQARLGWVVRWDKGPFRGRAALEAAVAEDAAFEPRRALATWVHAGVLAQ